MDGCLSMREADRLEVLTRVAERRLTRVAAAELLGLSERQVRRLYAAWHRDGPAGLICGHRGRPSNRRLAADVQQQALDLIRARYHDFGPTLAHEKLTEIHGLRLSVETLRRWMIEARIWVPRAQRARRSYQPRSRRSCLGELIQIDGCDHHWFEDRGPACTLLVFVDDATSRLMELRFAESESTFDYFQATRSYIERHGKPMAFYSDRASIFTIPAKARSGKGAGISQFGRALEALNIDIICANSPEAKGRVERAHSTMQDRLVKELRLRGLSSMEAAEPYLEEFMADYNRRFARPARNPHDVHRRLRPQDDLRRHLCLQEQRRITNTLTVHYKRDLYVLEDSEFTRRFRGARAEIHEYEDGTVEIQCQGHAIPYRIHHKETARISPGDVVENKRLGAVLEWIADQQKQRNEQSLANPKVSLREKKRIRQAAANCA